MEHGLGDTPMSPYQHHRIHNQDEMPHERHTADDRSDLVQQRTKISHLVSAYYRRKQFAPGVRDRYANREFHSTTTTHPQGRRESGEKLLPSYVHTHLAHAKGLSRPRCHQHWWEVDVYTPPYLCKPTSSANGTKNSCTAISCSEKLNYSSVRNRVAKTERHVG